MNTNKKMKFLVFGSSGMAGNTIATYLTQQGHDVTGFSRNSSTSISSIIGDVTDSDLVKNTIHEGRYDCIINCIGILNQFAEENKEKAVYLNSYFPHLLVSLTKEMATQVILMSTDCVFSGEKGSYKESDFPDGKSFYDRTKAIGEVNDTKNLTLRSSIVGPDINENGIGLLNWFMKQDDPMKGFTNAMWTGVTTLELAKIMEKAASENAVGLINMVYKEPISKFNLLNLFNKYLRNNTLKIEPFEGFVSDKSLLRTNFNFEYEVPNYETMISEMAGWMLKSTSKYPHYKFKK
ncbi:dTDP-4-dehydrorhamnose reductase [Flavobacterium omnivorum]|uniref:dTDP-4-dehydrorhamnose reductase n=1 Tax=Flavobacterium omnivorum TaxID=178355 RepID=A0A1G8DSB0_9FLAO|nr:sugar nucleotide-binding protein [Flavobacterium omnivorum]SDH60577.1 dTDP-4-dehydrorhamnose reductase [Flavobacterium omnivorum]